MDFNNRVKNKQIKGYNSIAFTLKVMGSNPGYLLKYFPLYHVHVLKPNNRLNFREDGRTVI